MRGVVLPHVIEESIFVAQMVVVLQLSIDFELVTEINLGHLLLLLFLIVFGGSQHTLFLLVLSRLVR